MRRCRETGHDALQAAVRILDALYAERETYAGVKSRVAGIDSPTLTVGRIEGGINTNVVPDRVTLRLDRRMIPEEDPQDGRAAAEGGDPRGGQGLAGHQGRRAPAPAGPRAGPAARPRAAGRCDPGARLRRARRGRSRATATPLYTDARLYAEAGVPIVLYGAGPRTILEANAKRADENLVLEDLKRATIVVAWVLSDLLST